MSNRLENKERSSTELERYLLQDPDFGVDYIGLVLRIGKPSDQIARWYSVPTILASGITSHRKLITITRNHHTVTLRPYPYNRDYFCTVEFNPSRFVDPLGWGLCPIDRLHDVIAEALSMVMALVDPIGPADEVVIRRLDIARDFRDVLDVERIIRGLFEVKRTHCRQAGVFKDSSDVPGSVSAGSRAGKVRTYDKCRQSRGQAPDGTVRSELEARSGWLKRYGGIYTLGNLTEANILRLFINRMSWFGLEREIITFQIAIQRIIDEDLDPRRFQGLIKYMFNRNAGGEQKCSDRTAGKYEQFLRELGIALLLEEREPTMVSRLDLASGREVVAS